MRGVNKAIIIGSIGSIDTKYTAAGAAVCNVSVATNEKWRDKNSGQDVEKTEWHRIVIFGKLAEIANQYLSKGKQVYFEGKIQTRKWQDQNGQDRYTTEIVANEMQMLGGKSDSTSAPVANHPNNPTGDKYATQSGRSDAGKAPAPVAQGGDQSTNFDDMPFFDPYKFNWRAL